MRRASPSPRLGFRQPARRRSPLQRQRSAKLQETSADTIGEVSVRASDRLHVDPNTRRRTSAGAPRGSGVCELGTVAFESAGLLPLEGALCTG